MADGRATWHRVHRDLGGNGAPTYLRLVGNRCRDAPVGRHGSGACDRGGFVLAALATLGWLVPIDWRGPITLSVTVLSIVALGL